MIETTRYPRSWPTGWQHTNDRSSIGVALDRLEDQLDNLRQKNALGSNPARLARLLQQEHARLPTRVQCRCGPGRDRTGMRHSAARTALRAGRSLVEGKLLPAPGTPPRASFENWTSYAATKAARQSPSCHRVGGYSRMSPYARKITGALHASPSEGQPINSTTGHHASCATSRGGYIRMTGRRRRQCPRPQDRLPRWSQRVSTSSTRRTPCSRNSNAWQVPAGLAREASALLGSCQEPVKQAHLNTSLRRELLSTTRPAPCAAKTAAVLDDRPRQERDPMKDHGSKDENAVDPALLVQKNAAWLLPNQCPRPLILQHWLGSDSSPMSRSIRWARSMQKPWSAATVCFASPRSQPARRRSAFFSAWQFPCSCKPNTGNWVTRSRRSCGSQPSFLQVTVSQSGSLLELGSIG